MRVALVCDWLTNVGGAERVLLKIHEMYPEAPIYTSQYNPKKIDWFRDAEVRTGWMQRLPARLRRYLGWFRARYFAGLDLSEYDLVISVTGAEAKAVKCENARTGQRAVHVSYCHVPTQYYWQMYDEYVKNPGFGILDPVVRTVFRWLVGPLRRRDYEAAQKVNQFVTISEYAEEMIQKYYQRPAKVVHPPVDLDNYSTSGKKSQGGNNAQDVEKWQKIGFDKGEYYVVTSRQVTWKRLDLAVKACRKLGRKLVVIGEGPEHKNLTKMAEGDQNVRFLPLMGKEELSQMLANARGYIFPSLEPFGIAPVEALAAGCPVIAYGEGGALDYVKDGVNGVTFPRQTVESVCEGILRFEKMEFRRREVAKTAEKFGEARFEKELRKVIDGVVA